MHSSAGITGNRFVQWFLCIY